MTEKRLRRRTPLRFKQIKAISSEIEARLNVTLNLSSSFLEEAHFEGVDLIVVDRLPRLMKLEKNEDKIYSLRYAKREVWENSVA